ncbi:MAG: T9SS type A sorting domain-containing protein [Muribaculaceae bacterium]|nr:T9SS type A sorting domain-containing protein [Muribaculaceae bacterium]
MKNFTTALLLCMALSAYSATGNPSLPSAPDGDVAGHGYVDLGLPSGTLWATCNIGSESPYHPGQYFAWGETKPRERFKWYDYEFYEEEYTDAQGRTNYSATDIGQQISGTEYDAARAQWGDAWRMPSKEDCEELLEYCQTEYVEYSHFPPKTGLHVCGPNGNSILLALTFSPHGGVTTAVLEGGEYWTATAATDTDEDSYPSTMMMRFGYGSSKLVLKTEGRHDGLSIRPVISRKDIITSVATLTDYTPAIKYENGVISINGYTDDCELTISDLSGRNICSSTIDDNIYLLPELSKGIYIIAVRKAEKNLNTIKIAVK